jgi:hypothetical protein
VADWSRSTRIERCLAATQHDARAADDGARQGLRRAAGRRDEKLARIVASIDVDNRDMQIVSQRVGFTVSYDKNERPLKARIDL